MLVLETCSGLILASVAERMGGHGTALATFSGSQPPSLDSVRLFNFSTGVRRTLCCASLSKLDAAFAAASGSDQPLQQNGVSSSAQTGQLADGEAASALGQQQAVAVPPVLVDIAAQAATNAAAANLVSAAAAGPPVADPVMAAFAAATAAAAAAIGPSAAAKSTPAAAAFAAGDAARPMETDAAESRPRPADSAAQQVGQQVVGAAEELQRQAATGSGQLESDPDQHKGSGHSSGQANGYVAAAREQDPEQPAVPQPPPTGADVASIGAAVVDAAVQLDRQAASGIPDVRVPQGGSDGNIALGAAGVAMEDAAATMAAPAANGGSGGATQDAVVAKPPQPQGVDASGAGHDGAAEEAVGNAAAADAAGDTPQGDDGGRGRQQEAGDASAGSKKQQQKKEGGGKRGVVAPPASAARLAAIAQSGGFTGAWLTVREHVVIQ